MISHLNKCQSQKNETPTSTEGQTMQIVVHHDPNPHSFSSKHNTIASFQDTPNVISHQTPNAQRSQVHNSTPCETENNKITECSCLSILRPSCSVFEIRHNIPPFPNRTSNRTPTRIPILGTPDDNSKARQCLPQDTPNAGAKNQRR